MVHENAAAWSAANAAQDNNNIRWGRPTIVISRDHHHHPAAGLIIISPPIRGFRLTVASMLATLVAALSIAAPTPRQVPLSAQTELVRRAAAARCCYGRSARHVQEFAPLAIACGRHRETAASRRIQGRGWASVARGVVGA